MRAETRVNTLVGLFESLFYLSPACLLPPHSADRQTCQHSACHAARIAFARRKEYLNSTKTNRQREVVMQNVLKSTAPSTLESLAAREREAATKHRSEMRSRRNNVVALRRSMTKPGKS